ncbi:hypothetical protein, conserved [Leishmania tarentolae]|uniref:Phosphopyruvate hydratase n=1 Tax=Leishmania tarentolae TaxID=5689 RepID=A0A640KRH1_LEITA|nr:hypothetical protein, conserved [Leishmania tarentolae]
MPSSVSWQRYDDEFHVSGVLTEAARACVSAHPTDVKDFFSRYFREVAEGTSVRALHHKEVLTVAGEAAVTFTVALCVGPEVSVTTGDLLSFDDKDTNGEARAPLAASEEATDAEGNSHSVIQTMCAAVVSKLLELGHAEPQCEWDSAIRVALSTSPLAKGAPAIQWALSIMASLVAARQRCVPLHQYIAALVDDRCSGERAVGSAHLTAARTSIATALTPQVGSVPPARPYSVPQLLVTFLVRAAKPDAPEAANSVRFSHVYVALDVLTMPTDDAYGDEKAMPVSGSVLRKRMQKVRKAAQRFLQCHPTSSSVCTNGTLHWNGAADLTDVVKAVTEALSAVQLSVGAEVCVGLSMGASTIRVPAAHAADGSALKDAAGDCKVLYSLFGGGEPPVTGDQLSEYVKEQLKEADPGALQFLEDTHATEDCVARQRLQMAVQDSVVLSDVVSVQQKLGSETLGLSGSLPEPADDSAFPNSAMNPCDCGTISDVVDYLCATAENSRRAISFFIDTSAGDPQTAAHIVDLAIAGGASYVIVRAGVFSPHAAEQPANWHLEQMN